MYNFRSLSNKFPATFEVYFLRFIAQVRIFFVQKKPKIFGFKNVMDRGIKKNFHFRNALNCIENIRGNNTEALAISKRLKFP